MSFNPAHLLNFGLSYKHVSAPARSMDAVQKCIRKQPKELLTKNKIYHHQLYDERFRHPASNRQNPNTDEVCHSPVLQDSKKSRYNGTYSSMVERIPARYLIYLRGKSWWLKANYHLVIFVKDYCPIF